MYTVTIYGAGSIGNHLAHACRTRGWAVTICDIDAKALERTREEIYPARYGGWDPEIQLATVEQLSKTASDLVIVGTPPDTHMALAASVLKTVPPRVLLIEKPLCPPSLEGTGELLALRERTGTFVAVGYNHTLTRNTRRAAEILKRGVLGRPVTISARFREHWGGIFGAHPWLSGPADTYLGFSARGGGAGGEHSHAMNIWQHFARLTGAGRIVEVSAAMDMIDDGVVDYDRICLLNVKTETGFVGNIAQDVVTEPAQKSLRIQGDSGFLEWIVNIDGDNDAVRYREGGTAVQEERFPKTRPDDFAGEVDHVEEILDGRFRGDSPVSLEKGLETMMVLAAAHASRRGGRTARIDYEKGYRPEAIALL